MKFDGFDMVLNGCTEDVLSIYQDDKYFQFTIRESRPEKDEEFCTLLSRDELVELKTRISMLLEFTE
jgi:hypothetical protein